MKGKRRSKAASSKNERKRAAFAKQDGSNSKLSKYGRKAAYLAKRELWGFEVPDKPWR